MKKLIDLDDLMLQCGYACDSEDNNGYGCNHKENEETECHRYCCPIAVNASYNDLLELDHELAKEYEYQLERREPDESLESDWMVQHSE